MRGAAAALELHFFYLISCAVDESPASVVNPHSFPIELSIAPAPDSDTAVQMAVQSRPSPSLTFSHAKYTNGCCPPGVPGAYGRHEYLPGLIMGRTHVSETNKRGNTVREQLAPHSHFIGNSVND